MLKLINDRLPEAPMGRYYLNTSILLDYYENRGPRGDVAKIFLEKAVKEDALFGYSDLTFAELKNVGYSQSQANEILQMAKSGNSRRLHINKEQLKEAGKIAKQKNIPRKDALHAILCRDNEFVLISADRHFELLKDVAETKKPEELI